MRVYSVHHKGVSKVVVTLTNRMWEEILKGAVGKWAGVSLDAYLVTNPTRPDSRPVIAGSRLPISRTGEPANGKGETKGGEPHEREDIRFFPNISFEI